MSVHRPSNRIQPNTSEYTRMWFELLLLLLLADDESLSLLWAWCGGGTPHV